MTKRIRDKAKAAEYSRRWRAKNPERAREIDRKRMRGRRAADPAIREKDRLYAKNYMRRRRYGRYGITPEDVVAMLAVQGGRCAICNTEIRYSARNDRKGGAHVDHCHETMRVRGILCVGCNVAIGSLGDNEAGLLRAVAYLRGQRFEAGIGEGLL